MDLKKSVFLDASVVLEIHLRRNRYKECINLIPRDSTLSICALSVHLLTHFSIKEGLRLSDCRDFLQFFDIISINSSIIKKSFDICHDDDYEDALQLGSFTVSKCDTFLTLDKKLYKNYSNRFNGLVLV